MLKIDLTSRFKKDLKKYEHNKPVKKELEIVLSFLLKEEKLPKKYLDHALTGSYVSFRECHVKPDTLLIYWLDNAYVHLTRIGSHSELF
ncbi:MAG: type II toxin-antitoxin system YafQ family toxin [Candidatus Rhabdochlamydia sp.]